MNRCMRKSSIPSGDKSVVLDSINMPHQSNGVDEERGNIRYHSNSHGSDSDEYSNVDSEAYFRRLDEAARNSSLISNVSEGELLDEFTEMSPIHESGSLRAPPSYGLTDKHDASVPSGKPHRLRRSASEESITTVTALPGMTIRSHSIQLSNRGDGKCNIRPSPTTDALRAVQLERRMALRKQQSGPGASQPIANDDTGSTASPFASKESYWIDIETPQSTSDELFEFLMQLRLPRFFTSLLCEPSSTWTSEVLSMKRVTLAVFQVLSVDPDSDEITHVALLSMPKLLVTFSSCPANETEGLYHLVSQYMRQRERVPEATSTGALLAWMQYHVRRTSLAIRELRQEALSLDESLDRDFAAFDFNDIIEAKNCLLRVLSVAEEQHGTIEALVAAENDTEGLDFSNCRGALSVLLAMSASNERLSSRVDKHLNELRERVMTHR
ncbi:hypothetical protein ACHAXS_008447, partial [Conticribra weissflogii]